MSRSQQIACATVCSAKWWPLGEAERTGSGMQGLDQAAERVWSGVVENEMHVEDNNSRYRTSVPAARYVTSISVMVRSIVWRSAALVSL